MFSSQKSFSFSFTMFMSASVWSRILGSMSSWASLVSQLVKNLPSIWETWVRSLGREDPLERGIATHSSILAWRNTRRCVWSRRLWNHCFALGPSTPFKSGVCFPCPVKLLQSSQWEGLQFLHYVFGYRISFLLGSDLFNPCLFSS